MSSVSSEYNYISPVESVSYAVVYDTDKYTFKRVSRSPHTDERNRVFRRRNIEKVGSAEAVVTSNVVRIYSRNFMFGYTAVQHSSASKALSAHTVPLRHLVRQRANSASTAEGLSANTSWHMLIAGHTSVNEAVWVNVGRRHCNVKAFDL